MLLRRVARPLLAGIFVTGGVNALRDPEGHVQMAGPILDVVIDLAPTDTPPSKLTLVKVDAAVKVAAGLLLATGKAPRLAATALAASLVPTTLAGHRFWEMDDPTQQAEHRTHFFQNAGLLGALMLASADTAGKPSLAWRANELSGQLSGLATDQRQQAGGLVGKAGERVLDSTEQLRGEAAKVGRRAAKRARKATEQAAKQASKQASVQVGKASKQASAQAAKVSKQASAQAEKASKQMSAQAEKASKQMSKHAKVVSKEAAAQAKRASKQASGRAKKATKQTADSQTVYEGRKQLADAIRP